MDKADWKPGGLDWYLIPEGRSLKREYKGSAVLPAILMALRVRPVRWIFVLEGRGGDHLTGWIHYESSSRRKCRFRTVQQCNMWGCPWLCPGRRSTWWSWDVYIHQFLSRSKKKWGRRSYSQRCYHPPRESLRMKNESGLPAAHRPNSSAVNGLGCGFCEWLLLKSATIA